MDVIIMTKSQIQKLIIAYSAAAIFICSCLYWNDPFAAMLSMGFILGFLGNETFFNSDSNDI
jgi:hypothetical protein